MALLGDHEDMAVALAEEVQNCGKDGMPFAPNVEGSACDPEDEGGSGFYGDGDIHGHDNGDVKS